MGPPFMAALICQSLLAKRIPRQECDKVMLSIGVLSKIEIFGAA
jgi:hypothetical protein